MTAIGALARAAALTMTAWGAWGGGSIIAGCVARRASAEVRAKLAGIRWIATTGVSNIAAIGAAASTVGAGMAPDGSWAMTDIADSTSWLVPLGMPATASTRPLTACAMPEAP